MSGTGRADGDSKAASPAEVSISWSAAAALARAAGARPATAISTFEDHLLTRLGSAEKARRGVHYTPAPLAGFVVRCLHELLEGLGHDGGITAPRVRLIDPAVGTGGFLAAALRLAVDVDPHGDRAALVGRAAALDIDPDALLGAVYELSRLSQGGTPHVVHRSALHPDTWDLTTGWPRGVEAQPGDIPAFVGNPPWAGYELGIHPWVKGLLAPYRQALQPEKRMGAKWLRDPYSQYLAVLHWALRQHEQGVLGLVVNHGVLDNHTMAGLRERWMGDVSGLWLLDLGGNVSKPGPTGEEGPDENVFKDVRRGAAVLLATRGGAPRGVHHHRLTGTREDKLRWLARNSVSTIPWQTLQPQGSLHLWVPAPDWPQGWIPLPEIFHRSGVGVTTGRDELVIAESREELLERIGRLRECRTVQEAREAGFELRPTEKLQPDRALQALRADTDWKDRIRPILYRVDAEHWIFYADYLVERPRWRLMRHLLGQANAALVVPSRAENPPEAVIASAGVLVGHKAVSKHYGTHVFPLWLFGDGERRSNLRASVLEKWSRDAGREVGPVAGFEHVARVLGDPGYCRRFRGALSVGWGRVAGVALLESL